MDKNDLLVQIEGVWYDSENEKKMYIAVKNGDVEGASEALKEDSELIISIFSGEDAEEIETVDVLKKDVNMGHNGMLCKAHCKNNVEKYYFITPYIYYGAQIDSDSYCTWVVIPMAG